jgi:hypothetical protein
MPEMRAWLLPPPNSRETSERMNFNDIDKKTFNLKTVYILISDVFFGTIKGWFV